MGRLILSKNDSWDTAKVCFLFPLFDFFSVLCKLCLDIHPEITIQFSYFIENFLSYSFKVLGFFFFSLVDYRNYHLKHKYISVFTFHTTQLGLEDNVLGVV